MANGNLAYGLACDSEKYFERESIQTVNSEDGLRVMMKEHGLDYTVEMHQMTNPVTGDGIPFFASVRTDTNAVLGAGMSDRYNAIQNTEGAAVLGDLSGIAKDGVTFARGMTFDAGRVAVMQLDLGEMVIGDTGRAGFKDVVKKRITWTNSHDGSGAAKIFTTPIRIVCANTLTAAMGRAKDGIAIRHTETAKDRLEDARKILKLVNNQLIRTEATYNALAAKKINNDHIREVLADLFPSEAKEQSKAQAEAIAQVGHFLKNADGGRIDPESGWNLYNSITHYTDHKSPIRIHNGRNLGEARFQSVIQGTIAEKNAKALSKIVKVLELDDDIAAILKTVETSQVAQLALLEAPARNEVIDIFSMGVGTGSY